MRDARFFSVGAEVQVCGIYMLYVSGSSLLSRNRVSSWEIVECESLAS